MKKTTLFLALGALMIAGAIVADRLYLKNKRGSAPTSAATAAAANLPDVPALSTTDLNGRPVQLSDYRGKVVLLNFWATYCGPCKIEMPWLIEFTQKYSGRGLVVLGVSMDDNPKSDVPPWLKEQTFEVNDVPATVNYPLLVGNDEIGEKFGVFGLPTTLLISRDGKILKRFIGLVSHEKIVADIEANL
jgi:cytochrome c biogenesis protein CcmG/thiol:disulfide interchange protein DsbE